MSSTFYARYYNQKGKDYSGWHVKSVARQTATGGPTDKQFAYLKDLIEFLKQRGIPTSRFERPRDKRDCSRCINAAITVLKKHNLDAEFFGEPEQQRSGAPNAAKGISIG